MKYVACRYCISSGGNEVWFALLLCSLYVCIGDSYSFSVSGILYNPLLLFLGSRMIIPPFVWLSLLMLWTQLCIQNNIFFQLIQVIYVREWVWCVPCMLKSSRHGFLDCIVFTIRYPTWIGVPMFFDGKCGASTCKYCLVSPVFDITVLFSLSEVFWMVLFTKSLLIYCSYY